MRPTRLNTQFLKHPLIRQNPSKINVAATFFERQIHNLGGEGAGNEVQTTAMLVFLLQCGIKVIFFSFANILPIQGSTKNFCRERNDEDRGGKTRVLFDCQTKAFEGPELNLTWRNSDEIAFGEYTGVNHACCEDKKKSTWCKKEENIQICNAVNKYIRPQFKKEKKETQAS